MNVNEKHCDEFFVWVLRVANFLSESTGSAALGVTVLLGVTQTHTVTDSRLGHRVADERGKKKTLKKAWCCITRAMTWLTNFTHPHLVKNNAFCFKQATLTYFSGFWGLSEPARTFAAASGFPLTFNGISTDGEGWRDAWNSSQAKKDAPMGQLPFLALENGAKICQSWAITTYYFPVCLFFLSF